MVIVKLASILILCSALLGSAEPAGDTKTVRGNYAVAGEIPYIVLLQVHKPNEMIICAGSIIRPSWILTAARCLPALTDDDNIVVIAGTVLREGRDGHERRGVAAILHPKYDNNTGHADIALIQLNLPLIYDKFEKPIALETAYITSGHATAAGWGLMNDEPVTMADRMKVLNTEIITNKICEQKINSLRKKIPILDSHICNFNTDPDRPCRGDSGGPLVVGNHLVGVLSFGTSWGCGVGLPTVYTRVSSFVNWINGVVDK